MNCPILFTDLNTAELIKHTANAFLATKISFINLVADICEKVHADVEQVATGIGMDLRIGRTFLNAGLGFGGYCLPKDLRAFIRLAEEHNVDASLLHATENINLHRIDRFMKKVRQALWIVQGKTLAIWGLAFKGGTDDIREAPSLRVVEALLKDGATLRLYDPKAMKNAKEIVPEQTQRVRYCADPYSACKGAHAVLVLTEWEEFRHVDLSRVRRLMQVPMLIDGRNLFNPEVVHRAGFEYFCLGRSTRPAPLTTENKLGPNALQSVQSLNATARMART